MDKPNPELTDALRHDLEASWHRFLDLYEPLRPELHGNPAKDGFPLVLLDVASTVHVASRRLLGYAGCPIRFDPMK
jgi:hypothetical protein